jgi:hypothetical protein
MIDICISGVPDQVEDAAGTSAKLYFTHYTKGTSISQSGDWVLHEIEWKMECTTRHPANTTQIS